MLKVINPPIDPLDDIEWRISEERIKKENIVLTLQINKNLPLFEMSCKLTQFTKTKPEPTSAIVLRLLTSDGKKISINLFPSGKVVITGAKNIYDAYSCIHNTLKILEREVADQKIEGENLSLRNIVMTVNVGKRILIDELARDNPENVQLDRKNFPGAIVSLPDENNPTANVFDTGKLVLPGPSTKKYALRCINWVYNQIRPYMTDEEPDKKRVKKDEEDSDLIISNFGDDFYNF